VFNVDSERWSKKRRLNDAKGAVEDNAKVARGAKAAAAPDASSDQEGVEDSFKPAALPPPPATLKAPLLTVKGMADDKSPGEGIGLEAVSAKAEVEEDDRPDERLTFPERLMYFLQNDVESNALWWQQDGLSFAFEPKLFTAKVLHKLFPTKIKFESFIRKLNRWGFRRVPGQGLPPNGAAYKHPLFNKDNPEMMKQMKFGQKTITTSQSLTSSASQLPTAGSSMLNSSHQQQQMMMFQDAQRQSITDEQSLLDVNSRQNAQHLALLQRLANAQVQPLNAADLLIQQQQQSYASNSGLNLSVGNTNSAEELRRRMLLGSLSTSSIPHIELALAITAPQQYHQEELLGAAGLQAGRMLPSSLTAPDLTSAALGAGSPSERELRNLLLFGSSSLPTQLQRQLSALYGADRLPFGANASLGARNPHGGGTASAGSGIGSMSQANFDAARLLFGRNDSTGGGSSNHALNLPPSSSSSLGHQLAHPPPMRRLPSAEQHFALLRQQQQHEQQQQQQQQQQQGANVGQSAELLFLLEQERLRRQREGQNNSTNN